jgi:hypothetical protein
MAFVAIKEWDGRLARHLWNGRDRRDARPTLLPPTYFHRGDSHAISATGH